MSDEDVEHLKDVIKKKEKKIKNLETKIEFQKIKTDDLEEGNEHLKDLLDKYQ